jgi:hypothetical protein
MWVKPGVLAGELPSGWSASFTAAYANGEHDRPMVSKIITVDLFQ